MWFSHWRIFVWLHNADSVLLTYSSSELKLWPSTQLGFLRVWCRLCLIWHFLHFSAFFMALWSMCTQYMARAGLSVCRALGQGRYGGPLSYISPHFAPFPYPHFPSPSSFPNPSSFPHSFLSPFPFPLHFLTVCCCGVIHSISRAVGSEKLRGVL